MPCPIGWSPNVLAPVFFGHHGVSSREGLPIAIRVFYPSIANAPEDAPLLADCGRYPLVLFLHGQCDQEPDHYLRWFEFPSVLARSGYIVAVPDFAGNTNPFDDIHLGHAQAVLTWMRERWEHRAQLAPETAVAGHSRGGVLAGRLAAAGLASAYVGLSAVWHEAVGRLNVLGSLGVPAMFSWGTLLDHEAQLAEGSLIALWNEVKPPKLRLRFIDGSHFDYLTPEQSRCSVFTECDLVGAVAAEVAACFLSRHLPPPDSGMEADSLSLTFFTMTPPVLTLTPEQEPFAEGHFRGLRGLAGHPKCAATLDEGPLVSVSVTFTPKRLDFGAVPLNTVRTKSLVIENTGSAQVSVSVQAPPSGGPFKWSAMSADLQPGDTRIIEVQFRPTTTAIQDSQLRATSTPPSAHTIALSGKGAGGLPVP